LIALGTGPSLYPHVGYEPRKDFSPLGLIASSPALVLVYKDLLVHNVHGGLGQRLSNGRPSDGVGAGASLEQNTLS
jgi:hypothetical protein